MERPLDRPDGETDGHREVPRFGIDLIDRYRGQLRELIRANPTASVLIAVAAGYLVGRLLRA